MSFGKKPVIVVAGPTAVGKTEFCVRLAEHFGTEVVSADSRQIYREMSIGTAKPTPAEQRGVPHHFIDSHSITDDYTAAAFARDALACLAEILSRRPTAVVAGGSTLYVKTLTDGLDEIPDIDPAIRLQLLERLAQSGLPDLLAQLDELDAVYARQVDRANPQRVVRALEVCIGTGRPYSSFRTGRKAERPFRFIKIGLNRDRPELYDRIDRRVDAMLEAGLVDEARRLYRFKDKNALQTVGYQEVFGWMDGLYDAAEMVRLLKRNTRHYAKRQLTFFTRDPEYRWFHPDVFDEVGAYLSDRW
ncbi:MAG: tRNA (adenosine(37)-N6)-dimethylallyltransferase MiaA [Cytophagales bacterium]|nr:tRNA (adenosine(37)-N6)-dimethylallyltransferase MiaA [Cytophagales bacterium]